MRWLGLLCLLSVPVLSDTAPAQPQPGEFQPAGEGATAHPAPQAQAPAHPQGVEKAPSGVIQGGWGYVYAAYGAGLLGLVVYAASLFLRRSTESQQQPPGAS